MRSLYDKFGLTKTKFQFGDIAAAATEVAGSDMTDFFKRYVDGKELLPVKELLLKVGYESASQWYANEMLIIPTTPTARKSEWLALK
jgi:predicted metalloprotease with PDZ domain